MMKAFTPAVIRLFAYFAMGAVGFSQPAIRPLEGSDTVRGLQMSPDGRAVLDTSGQVLLRLPATKQKGLAELMGMLKEGDDIELFLRQFDEHAPAVDNEFSLEIFRGRRGAEATFVHSFPMAGAFQWVRFFQPPDARDKPAVIVDVNPGSVTLWTYLLAPDRRTMQKLFESSGAAGGEFMDLDGDGVYELIGRGNGGSDRCSFHLSPRPGPGTVPQIFIRVGTGYRQVFPSRNSALGVVDATFADLRRDGGIEMIALQEGPTEKPSQTLAVYRLENKSLRLEAQTSLPEQPVAFLVDTRDAAAGKEILVRSATPSECEAPGGKNPEESGTVKAYVLRGDKLEAVQP